MFVNRYFLIILLIFPMFLMCAKPYIESYNNDEKEIKIVLFHKSKECGFINIYKERRTLTFQFSCGWSNFRKGHTKLSDVYFDYINNSLVMISKENHKRILKIKCDKQIFDEIMDEIDNIKSLPSSKHED